MTMLIPARNLSLVAHFGASKHASALTTLYFALTRGDMAAGGSEPTATGGYARVAKTNDATLWGTIVSTDVAVVNKGASGEILWPAATGLYSIADALTHWAVYDNSSGGVLWYTGLLSTQILVTGAGDQPRLAANALTITQGG